ncbi:TolC family protein [Rhodobacteraceae bacterium M385]|nr:TolC family protein [Rhodobacteraceae bacterium M385]
MLYLVKGMARNFARSAGAAAIVVSLAAFGAGQGQAQTLSLTEAYQRMLDREVQYQILDLELDVAAELVQQARGERRPRVGLRIQYINTSQEIISQDNGTFQEGTSEYPTTRVTFSVRQPLYDAVRFRALPVAQAEAELVSAQAAVARNDLSGMLINSYLDVARAQIGVEQARILIRARTQLERDIGLQVDAGRIEVDQLFRAQGDVLEARVVQSERDLDLTNALFDLYRFTGPDVTGVAYAGAAVGIPTYNNLVGTFSAERLLELSPAIQVARAEVAVSERQLEVVRASFRPTANVTLEFESEETEGSLFGGGSNVQSTELGVDLNWSIYEGGTRRSRVREAEARVEIANLRVEQIIDLSQRRYEGLTSALESSLRAVNAISAEQAAAGRRLSAAIEQENAGRIGPEAALEARLRRDTLSLQGQIARLRVVQLQAQLLALFGALDVDTLSQDFSGS